jgi:hypothetical protein
MIILKKYLVSFSLLFLIKINIILDILQFEFNKRNLQIFQFVYSYKKSKKKQYIRLS